MVRRTSDRRRSRAQAVDTLTSIVRWYAEHAYGRLDGGRRLPFYCVPDLVGRFAIEPADLAAGRDRSLFALLVAMSMYQSRRDVDIMRIQRGLRASTVKELASPARLRLLVAEARCDLASDPGRFVAECDVRRGTGGQPTCDQRPRTPCHVKRATTAIGRMGDMGKLPTSAWLFLEPLGGLAGIFAAATLGTETPRAAADVLVALLSQIHRVGIKLATMFVSALSVPALAPGLTPWWPAVDGNHLVVVDVNVARVIDTLRPRGPKTFASRAAWFRDVSAEIDLNRIRRSWPSNSPRIVQQATYLFRSASNRRALGERCALGRCVRCLAPAVCPYYARRFSVTGL